MAARHQQFHPFRFQQRIRHIHSIGHGNDIRVLAQHSGNFKGRGARVENNAMARLHQRGGGLSDAALDRRIERTYILNGGLDAGHIAFTN